MTDLVTGAREAGSERHPLRDVLLGAWALLDPVLAAVRGAATNGAPLRGAAIPTDAELLDVGLGVLAVAWRLEGVLLAVRAAAAPSPPSRPAAPAERLLR